MRKVDVNAQGEAGGIGYLVDMSRFDTDGYRWHSAARREGRAMDMDALKRLYGRYIVDHVDFRGVKAMAFGEAQMVANKVLAMFEAGEFDVATLFFSEFKSVISQIPTAQKLPLKRAPSSS